MGPMQPIALSLNTRTQSALPFCEWHSLWLTLTFLTSLSLMSSRPVLNTQPLTKLFTCTPSTKIGACRKKKHMRNFLSHFFLFYTYVFSLFLGRLAPFSPAGAQHEPNCLRGVCRWAWRPGLTDQTIAYMLHFKLLLTCCISLYVALHWCCFCLLQSTGQLAII